MLTRPKAILILYGTFVMGWDEAIKLMGEDYSGVSFKDVLFAMGVQEEEFHRAVGGDNAHNA